MVKSEDEKPPKSDDKSPVPTAEEQSNVHVYPEWAAMQAYYGSRVAFPTYYNPAVTPGHHPPPPPYMWGPPQPIMAPYGTPYAAIYAGGGVYAHPGIPIAHVDGAHSSSAMGGTLAGTALSIDTPMKSSAKTENGLVKKLKSFEGLTMSIGNVSSEKYEGSSENRSSQSGDSEGSSDGSNGSDGNTEGAEENKRKRSRDDVPIGDLSEQPEIKPTTMLDVNMCSSDDKVLGVPVSSSNGTMGMVTTNISSPVATKLELSNSEMNGKEIPAASAPNAVMPFDSKNEREIKKERRKQSNRESARRSRLRKQAETEELAKKVESLTAENMVLKSEINQLVLNSKKLRQDNADLTDKLKTVNQGSLEETDLNKVATDKKTTHPLNTENFLARVNRSSDEGGGSSAEAVNSGKKLHQLLVSNRRADAVAAG